MYRLGLPQADEIALMLERMNEAKTVRAADDVCKVRRADAKSKTGKATKLR